jgi:hypothetical protein
MYKAFQYTVTEELPYLSISGVYADNVVIVDRNGIGIKHSTTFSGSETVDLYTYLYYQVKPTNITATNYIIPIYADFVPDPRTLEVLYEFGPTPTVGLIYSIAFGNKIAKYKVLTGNTTMDVRDGIKAAVDALTWDVGTTVSTTSVSTNRLQINLAGDFTYPSTQIGAEKFKKGYYVIYENRYYIAVEASSTTGYPTLPAVEASYDIGDLFLLPLNLTPLGYLTEPNATYTYSDSVTDTTMIDGLPAVGNVAAGECVIDFYNQKIWFDNTLNLGEIIKVFQK